MDRKRIAVSAAAAGMCIVLIMVMLLTMPVKKAPRVGICIASLKNSKSFTDLIQDDLTKNGCTVSIADAAGDQSVQLKQLQQLISDGCDAVIIDPVMRSATEELSVILEKANIPAVFIGQPPENSAADQQKNICYVTSDASQLGYLQGQLILDVANHGDVNDDGIVSYLLLQDDPQMIHTLPRSTGAVQALTDAGVSVTALKTLCGYNDQAESRTLCMQSLAELGKDIEVIFCNTDTMALGALEAIQDGGWVVGTDIYLVGIGGDQEVLKKINDGILTGTIMEDIAGQATTAANTALRLLHSETVARVCYIDYLKITKENIALYLN